MTGLGVHGLQLERGGRTLCRGLNLAFGPGQCWCILGPNGAGKTTLLHALAGLYPTTQGEINLDGQATGGMSRRTLARSLGILLQDPAAGFPATVLQTVLQGRHPHLHPWAWESEEDIRLTRQALARLGLESLAQRSTDSLSGGERQRMAIATLLTQDPQYMLLDEPVNHLDLHQQIRTLELFRELTRSRQKTVIMVLHDVNLAQRYCDHVILMQGDGEVQAGRCGEVLNTANLSRLFGHPMQAVAGPHGTLYVPD
jgi:iron complex transport system ATP-binding protein